MLSGCSKMRTPPRQKKRFGVIQELKHKLYDTEKDISNIVNVVVSTGSAALTDKLRELEEEKEKITQAIADAECQISRLTIDEKRIKAAFYKAKQMLKSGTLKNRKSIIEKYVKQIIMYKDKIEIEYRISNTYSFKEDILRNK